MAFSYLWKACEEGGKYAVKKAGACEETVFTHMITQTGRMAMTWNETVEAYLSTQRGITADRYRHALDDFVTWYRGTYGEEPEPKLLTDEEAREWRACLTGVKKYAAATVNVRLSALKGLVRHAGGRLEIKGMRKVQQPIEPLSGRELGRLVRATEQHEWGAEWMPKRNAALIALMARAGLRIGEVVGLDLEDVALNERSGWVTIRQGKGLKERRVPLGLQARKALTTYLDVRPGVDTPALFVTKSWRRMSERPVQRLVKSAAQRAGVQQNVTPHVLRHTFATRFLRKGGDLATLRDILGHANLATTSRYLHADATRMQEMVEDL
jgi:site-specific recombinase XerD